MEGNVKMEFKKHVKTRPASPISKEEMKALCTYIENIPDENILRTLYETIANNSGGVQNMDYQMVKAFNDSFAKFKKDLPESKGQKRNKMKLTETQARRAVRKWLFEYATDSGVSHRASTDDKIAGKLGDNREDQPSSTIPKETPIVAVSQMATQFTEGMPPIEDPEFVPSTVQELGLCSKLFGERVPHAQIEWFYGKIIELAEEALDRNNAVLAIDEYEDGDELEPQINPQGTNETFNRWKNILKEGLTESRYNRPGKMTTRMKNKKLTAQDMALTYDDDEGGFVDDDGEYVPTAEEIEEMGEGDPASVYGYREDIHSPESLQRRKAEIASGEGGEAKLRELLSLNLFPGVTTMSGLKKKIDAEINPMVQMWYTANPAFTWLQRWYDDEHQLTWKGKQVAGPDVYKMALDAYIKYHKKRPEMKEKLAQAIERGNFYEETMAQIVMKPLIAKWRKCVADGSVDVSSSKAKNNFVMSDWVIETVLDSGFGKSGNKRKAGKVQTTMSEQDDFINAIEELQKVIDAEADVTEELKQQDLTQDLPTD